MKIRKKLIASAMIVAMMMGTATTALAGQWQQNSKGWWWQEDNGAYPSHSGSGSMAIRMALQNAITLMAAAICFQIPRPRMDM